LFGENSFTDIAFKYSKNRLMAGIRTFNLCMLVFSIVLMSCGGSRKNKDSDNSSSGKPEVSKSKSFAIEYSQKLGVRVPETANQKLITTIYDWMGVPYKYGGNDKKGVDCSGFINIIYPIVYNTKVPRVTVLLEKEAEPVKRHALKEGDLVFFKINTKNVGHAGIYLFDDYFVHASTSRGVIISKLEEIYWNKYFVGGGRFSK
jgi:lipoprotein Spr